MVSTGHSREGGGQTYQVRDVRLVDFLSEVITEDLDERDLQGRNLAVHEDTRQVQLDLETDVDVGTIDGWTPPEREATVRNLVETRPLRVRQLLVTHRLLEAGRLLPEETLPGREVGTLEERVLQDTLNTTERGNDIDTVVVELPKLAVMTLRSPPEGVARM